MEWRHNERLSNEDCLSSSSFCNTTIAPPASISTPSAAPAQVTYRVKRIADGDTITVVDRRGADIKIRFSCLDAPEVPHTKKEPESYDPADLDQFKWGSLARNRLTQLIHQGGDCVVLNVVDTDRYGRSVAEVRLRDGTGDRLSNCFKAIASDATTLPTKTDY